MLTYWEELAIRTSSGTLLPEASMVNFLIEIQAYLQGYRTGVYVMNTSTSWAQLFLREHEISPQDANVNELVSIAEKELNAYVKHEKKAAEEKAKVSKNAEKALMKAFDVLGVDIGPREAIIGVAIAEMKIDPVNYIATLEFLKSFVKDNELFYVGPPPSFFWGRFRNSKGEQLKVVVPAARTNGVASVGDSKIPQRYTSKVKALGFVDKPTFLRAVQDLGGTVNASGGIDASTATMGQLKAWLTSHKWRLRLLRRT